LRNTCVCYCTDPGYIVPTLVSAIQARAAADYNLADIVICCIDFDLTARSTFEAICIDQSIRVFFFDNDVIDHLHIMFARLFIDRFLPDSYGAFLYIDGDTQFRGLLNDLLRLSLEPGKIQAVADPMSFVVAEGGLGSTGSRTYLQGLGLADQTSTRYLNSGVLRASRSDWREVSRDALAYWKRWPERCKHRDQSALNAVLQGNYTPISLRWNFPVFMRNCGVEARLQPVIYHFCSNPRPWSGNFPPWDGSFVTPYQTLLIKYPQLLAYAPKSLSGARRVQYFFQQRFKRVFEALRWKHSALPDLILQYDRQSTLSLLADDREPQGRKRLSSKV
jgi:lipopolysaccharide biosynthesis glycosyltransferase